eukprot:5271336-Pleurochrysis_carterae.AAC.1
MHPEAIEGGAAYCKHMCVLECVSVLRMRAQQSVRANLRDLAREIYRRKRERPTPAVLHQLLLCLALC